MFRHNLNTALALLALAAGMGGSAYAGTTIAKNSVGSAQIKNGSIKSADINSGTRKALKGTTAKPDAKAVKAAVEDVIQDPNSGLTINVKGEKGADGRDGATGPQGPAGPAGFRDVQQVSAPWTSGGAVQTVSIDCPAGYRVSGGGGVGTPPFDKDYVRGSYPSGASQWSLRVEANASGTIYAVCVA